MGPTEITFQTQHCILLSRKITGTVVEVGMPSPPTSEADSLHQLRNRTNCRPLHPASSTSCSLQTRFTTGSSTRLSVKLQGDKPAACYAFNRIRFNDFLPRLNII